MSLHQLETLPTRTRVHPAARQPLDASARLAHELGKLPGIGPKTAERLTHHLLAADRGEVLALADALRAIKEQVRPCRQCFNLTEGELCSVCRDPKRDASVTNSPYSASRLRSVASSSERTACAC